MQCKALEAADLAYDRSLLASTRALVEFVSIVDGKVVADVSYVALDSFETDTLGRIYYKVTGLNGDFVSGYDDLPPLPKDVARSEAYLTLVYFYHASYRGEPVRIAALYQPVHDDTMRGHPLLLHEMIANLVDNAIRYTPSGGKVSVRVLDGATPALEIEDSGPGIPASERERVFAPFYRAASAQAVNAAGSGLGLTIMRRYRCNAWRDDAIT